MLRDAGASHVIVGHSERRTDCGEPTGGEHGRPHAAATRAGNRCATRGITSFASNSIEWCQACGFSL